jgi:hypothetical protein
VASVVSLLMAKTSRKWDSISMLNWMKDVKLRHQNTGAIAIVCVMLDDGQRPKTN